MNQSSPGIIDSVVDAAAGSRYVTIRPKLLNRGEHFTVRFMYDGREPLSVRGRFKDQTRPILDQSPVVGASWEEVDERLRLLGRGPFTRILTRALYIVAEHLPVYGTLAMRAGRSL